MDNESEGLLCVDKREIVVICFDLDKGAHKTST